MPRIVEPDGPRPFESNKPDNVLQTTKEMLEAKRKAKEVPLLRARKLNAARKGLKRKLN